MSFEQPSSVNDLLNYRVSRLLSASGALVTRLCEGRFGITRREWRLIALLESRGALSPSELAALAHLDRAIISRLVSGLIDKGLLLRTHSSTDGRRASVDLTERGRGLYDELFPLSRGINCAILSSLDAKQLRVLDKALTTLTEAAEALNKTYAIDDKADRRNGGSRRFVQSALVMGR